MTTISYYNIPSVGDDNLLVCVCVFVCLQDNHNNHLVSDKYN